jgi:phosphoribosylamine-glycine ligase
VKLLVIGSGGREHAIAWRLTQNPRVQKVYVAPGNAGTALEPGLENIAIAGNEALIAFAKKENIHLTVVGPEAPLAEGVVDAFRAQGLRIFGPTRACARLESSKEFAKEFMVRYGIPTAAFGSFTEVKAAHEYIDRMGAPMDEVIYPTVRGMAAEGNVYTGFLYAGLMIDKAGNPKVLEFNCRLGDPETQPILLRLKSDLLELVEQTIDGRLDTAEADWDRRAALGVVLAAHGYPDAPRKGDAINGIPAETEDCKVFHAGTELQGKQPRTSGGRVLCVTALGDSIKLAQQRAYRAVDAIRFDGMQYRRDIGHRAIAAKKS